MPSSATRQRLPGALRSGASGMRLVPDLATSLGKVSDNGLTWTYHLSTDLVVWHLGVFDE